ncbi:MAG TPA: glycosyltransferase family 2 protein [Rhodanobacteraceae bacterium]
MEGVRDGLTSVVVVAADSGPLLLQCVDRVLGSRAPVEIIVVDNASTDGVAAECARAHAGDSRFRLVANAVNRGFGPACNQGAAVANGDAFVFLNPDCLIDADTIAALRAIAAADRSIGLLGVDVRTPDGAPARGNRRRDPTLRRAFNAMSGLSRFESRWRSLAGVEMPAPTNAPPVERVDAVSGACMFVPRAVFLRVGGFDEAYFLHVEDLDLCRRVRDAGHAVAIASGVRVVHAQGSSSRHRPVFVAAHKRRGMWRYFRTYDPAARNPLLGALVWMGLWLRFALSATAALRPPSRDNAV